MERVGIYNRCSTEEEAQVNALNRQAEESREIALRRGWIITGQYIESESGTSTRKRTEYQRLMSDMETDLFDIVMIKSIDRLMRSTKDWYLFLDRLVLNDKRLYIYIDDKFYTAEDGLITGIKAILAEDFSRELSKKIKNAHRRRQEKKTGLNISTPMFGWDRISANEFAINEAEAERYREAFQMAKDGKGFHTISNYMYEQGVRGKGGGKIPGAQWRNMLYSPRAHGTAVMHKEEYDFDAKKKIKLPPEEWIYYENALPAIVSKEYQEEVLGALAERTVKCRFDNYTRDMSKVGLYELSGKLICGDCGAVYYRTSVSSPMGDLIEWKCSRALKHGRRKINHNGCDNINVVEEEVMNVIEEACKKKYGAMFGSRQGVVDEALASLREVLGGKNPHQAPARLQKEYERLSRKRDVLFHKLMEETIRDQDFAKYNSELTEKINDLAQKIKNIEGSGGTYNDYEGRMLQIQDLLRAGSVVDRAKVRDLVAGTDRITVRHDGTLEIHLNRAKTTGLLRTYGFDLPGDGPEDGFFTLTANYVHKTNVARRRERINERILELFRENPDLMLKDVVNMTEMKESYVHESVRQLKAEGRLRYERHGNQHAGKWIVINANP